MPYKKTKIEALLDSQGTLLADIYIFLPINNRYVCYGNAGLQIIGEKWERINQQFKGEVFVQGEELKRIEKLKSATLESFKTLAGPEKIQAFSEAMIASTTIKPEELMKFIQETSEEVIDELYEEAKDLQNFIAHTPDLLKLLDSAKTIAGLSMAFAGALGYEDKNSFSHITQASMLMDCSLTFIKDEVMEEYYARTIPPDSPFNEKFQAHPESSLQIVKSKMPGLSETVEKLISNHHERIDGSGYPKGVKKFEIPELAQVLGLAVDVYEDIRYAKSQNQDIMIMEILEGYIKEIKDGLHERHSVKTLEAILTAANI